MSAFLSLDDLFTAGLGFDLAGATLLGVGLLVSPWGIAQRSTTFPGYNSDQVVSLAQDRIDASVGLASIGLGFLCQAAAYIAVVSGAKTGTGWRTGLGAGIAAGLAALVVGTLWRIL